MNATRLDLHLAPRTDNSDLLFTISQGWRLFFRDVNVTSRDVNVTLLRHHLDIFLNWL